ncbi:MAG: Holliday junction branch migration protein RuvA [Bacilli bacterium]|nr:Holliday junction branch migration protein RuvA [Bacilli bacterium]
MYNYIKGMIVDQTASLIVVDNNGIGYDIYVSNPYAFELDKEYKVYLYHHITENSQALFGFKTKEEKELFLKLINVKGLGPKIALPMFATGSVDGIVDAIDRENVLYLTKFPKVGDKLARQIILDLKGKLAISSDSSTSVDSNELVEVLDNLGYKKPEIKKVLPNIDYTKSLEEQIKDALRLMLK